MPASAGTPEGTPTRFWYFPSMINTCCVFLTGISPSQSPSLPALWEQLPHSFHSWSEDKELRELVPQEPVATLLQGDGGGKEAFLSTGHQSHISTCSEKVLQLSENP